MSIIPSLTAREIITALTRAGFRAVRQIGSHLRFQHIADPTRQTSVPIHPGNIPRWLIHEIIKQAKIPVRVFLKLLKKK